MDSLVDKILEGMPVKEAIQFDEDNNSGEFERKVWAAAKDVFAADKKLWDLMAFSPEKYKSKELQDALNAFSKWYQYFLRIKED